MAGKAFVLLLSTAVFVLAEDVKPQSCRLLPGDAAWPKQDAWDAFNRSVGGRLIKTVPIGSPCHDPTFDQAKCDAIRANWHDPAFHLPNPSSIQDTIFVNKTCDPFDPRGTPCKIGAYVQYAVNVSTPDHIIKTVQFSKKSNIRLVVKNTGHDVIGRSTGTGAISVWTHNVQGVEFIPRYSSKPWNGPAFKVMAGMTSIQVSREANRRGLVVVHGECPTVGFAGGYIQGGGHSMISPLHGLAADQALEFEVVTTTGKFVRASAKENSDLYWALRGGGGGTYGIVWSVTVKAFPDAPVTVASLNFTSSGITKEVFWAALDAYHAFTPHITDSKIFTDAQYTPDLFALGPIFGVNRTAEDLFKGVLRPFTDTLTKLGVNYITSNQSFSNYLDAHESIGPLVMDSPSGTGLSGSRLIPRSVLTDKKKLGQLQKTLRSILESGGLVLEFVVRPTREVAGNPDNAVLPAWRDADKHLAVLIPLADGENITQVHADEKKLTNVFMSALKKVTPHSGAYHNEADPNDPDWKQTFWGANYDRLLQVKNKWDPDQLLYGKVSVGGDRWVERQDGRLCKAN